MDRYENLPPAIAAKLDESVRRVRRILMVRGICITVAVFIAAILGMMAIDAMVMIFSPVVRWGLWLAAVGAAGWTAWTALIKPLRRKFTAAEIAALIERNHPELEERLSTVVELAQAGDDSASRSLMESITMDAIKDVGTVTPEKEFTTRTVKPRLIAAAVTLGILAGLFAAFPKATARLVTRAIIPSAEVDNIYASALKVTPGDKVVLAGTSFSVNLAVEEGFPDKAYVRTRFAGSRGESVERMTRVSALEEKNAFYSFDYPSVSQSFTYRVNCGSALTRGYSVTVIPVPAFTDRRIRVTHPAYTGRPPDEYTNTAEIAALAGARVAVSVRPDRDGISGVAELPRGRRVAGARDDDGRLVFTFDLGANDAGEWGIALGDRYGFSNAVEKASVRITKDEPPQLVVTEPVEESMELPPYGQVPFDCEISNDYGVTSAVIQVSVGGAGFAAAQDLARTPAGDRRWTGRGSFELATLNADERKAPVRLRLAVTDNCPKECGGPHTVCSREFSLRIVARGDSLAAKSLANEIKATTLDIAEVKKALEGARRQLEDASKHIDSKADWQKNNGEKQLEAAEKNLRKAEDMLKNLTNPEDGDPLAHAKESMKPVLDEHVRPDRKTAEDLRMLEKGAERAKPTKDLSDRVDEAVKALDEAKKNFDAAAKEAVETQKLAELAEREQALAELAEKGEIAAEDLAERQAELSRKFESDFCEELNDPMVQGGRRADELANRAGQLEQDREGIEQMEKGDARTRAEAGFNRELDRFAKEADAFARKASQELGENIPNADKKNLPGEKQKWDDIREKFGQKGGEDAGQFDEMQEQMKGALDAANEAAKDAQGQQDQKKGDRQQGQKSQQQSSQDSSNSQQKSQDNSNSQQSNNQQSNSQQQNALQQAAQKMKSAAQKNAEKMGTPLENFMPEMDAQPSDEESDSQGTGSPGGRHSAERSRRRAVTRLADDLFEGASDWFKVKSESSSGAESTRLDDVPAEYRELVREYFRALNEGSAK